MKKAIKLISLLIFFVVISCKDKGSQQYLDPDKFFSKDREVLKGVILEEPIWNNKLYSSIFHTQYGILCVTDIRDNNIQLLDPETGKLILKKGILGRGPLEVVNPFPSQYDYNTSTLLISDPQVCKAVQFRIGRDSILAYEEFATVRKSFMHLRNINDSVYLGVTFSDQFIGIYDRKGVVLDSVPYRPITGESINYKNHYYNLPIAFSPNKKYLVTAPSTVSKLELYEINDDYKLNQIWERTLFEYIYELSGDWYKTKPEQQLGFEKAYMTDNFIYVTAQERTALEYNKGIRKDYSTLLVYDYKGNLLRHVILDSSFGPFSVTPDDKFLYSLILKDDEYYIVKYSLK